MYQYSMLGLDNLAISGGKEILVYLEKNETYYIDVLYLLINTVHLIYKY